MLTIQDGQGECRQHSGILGDGVGVAGVAGIIFISNQLLDGLLERQNGEVPRQTNVRMGIKMNGIDENNARIGRASGMECHHYEDQAGWSLQDTILRSTILSARSFICLNSSKYHWIIYEDGKRRDRLTALPPCLPIKV